MKRIALLAFYDTVGPGVRTLAAVARQHGVEPHIVFLKQPSRHIPLLTRGGAGSSNYAYYCNGLLRGGNIDVDPVSPREEQLTLEVLEELQPDLIGFSSPTFGHPICARLYRLIKRRWPRVPVLAGGWGPTLEPERFLAAADLVCISEGEQAMAAICAALRADRPITDAPNLAYLQGGALVRNPMAPPLQGELLDAQPLPDFTARGKTLIAGGRRRAADRALLEGKYYCHCSRGCPMRCSYCLVNTIAETFTSHSPHACRGYRPRSCGGVLDELRRARSSGAQSIRFTDGIFPFSRAFLDEFLRRYPQEIGLPFFCNVHPALHSAAAIRQLRDAGMSATAVGIQSGASEIRQQVYRRNMSREQIQVFANQLVQLGVSFDYHLIFGNPLESEAHLEESLRFSFELPPSSCFLFRLELFPGSSLSGIVAQRPARAPTLALQQWYALLHSLSFKGGAHRRLARWIHARGLFRRSPWLLTGLFVPSLLFNLTPLSGKDRARLAQDLRRLGQLGPLRGLTRGE